MLQIYFNFGSIMLFIALMTSLPHIRSTLIHCGSLLCAIFFLIFQYLTDNFSYDVVYNHSHQNLPVMYKLTALWSSYEGSILLWSFVLAAYNLLFSSIVKISDKVRETAINIQSTLCTIFILFLLFVANPFMQSKVFAINGIGLSPSLQDYMFTVHPPFLYLGYVGFSMIFSIAISILLSGEFTKTWADAIKIFTFMPLVSLAVGIILGMWWSYRELGWGGIWAWDPVENIALMPLILAISLLHSLIIVKKHSNLKNFSLFLCILIFNIAIVGTFVSRSGTLDSVHAFAEGDERNLYIILILCLISSISFGIFLYKSPRINNSINTQFALSSRLGFLVLSNVCFVFATVAILFGTLAPFMFKQLSTVVITVNESYYNDLFRKIVIIVLILITISPRMHWTNKANINKFIKEHKISIFINSGIFLIFLPQLLKLPYTVVLLIMLSLFLIIGIFENFCRKIGLFTLKWTNIFMSIKMLSRSYYSTNISHLGFGTMILSLCLMFSGRLELEKDLKIGEYLTLAGHQILMKEITMFQNKNFESVKGTFLIDHETKLKPEYRFYKEEKSFSSEADTTHLKLSDIMINITSFSYKNNTLSVNIIYSPYIQLVWFSIILTILGSAIGLSKKIIVK